MKRHFRSLAFVVLVVSGFFVSSALAAETIPAIEPVAPALKPAPAPKPPPPNLITVDFPGGALSELIAMLSRSDAKGFNLIGEKDDLATELPPFAVRSAEAYSFASAIDLLLLPKGLTVSSGGGTVFVVRKLRVAAAGKASTDGGGFESFQLARYLTEKQSVNDVIGAIRAGLQLSSVHDPEVLQLKFHPPTGILLTAGPAAAINVARNVISQLQRTAPLPGELLAPSAPARPSEEDMKRMQEWTAEIERRRTLRDAGKNSDGKETSPAAATGPVPAKK